MDKPDLIIIPNCKVNSNIPDLNSAWCAGIKKIPVFDLNSFNSRIGFFDRYRMKKKHFRKIAFSVRNFATGAVQELKREILGFIPDAEFAFLKGPLDLLCCYRYEQDTEMYDPGLSFSAEMPMPNYEMFSTIRKLKSNWDKGKYLYALCTSCGCPFGCRFCMARQRKWVSRTPANCRQELKSAKESYNIGCFQIVDDCFNFDTDRVSEFCAEIKQLDLRWFCNNGLRADRFSAKQAQEMAAAGCTHIAFGAETVDNTLLDSINKGETFEQIDAGITYAQEAKISVSAFFLIGLPGSSYETDKKTLEWARARNIITHFSYFVPPEYWTKGGQQFWGDKASPLSNAYPKEQQMELYHKSWNR